jgi:hypothetical protein
MRLILFAAIATCILGTSARAADSSFEVAGKSLVLAIQAGDCKAGLPLAREILADARFETMPDDAKLALLSFATDCANHQNLQEEAFEDARQATQLSKADDWLWTFRIEMGIHLSRPDDVADTFMIDNQRASMLLQRNVFSEAFSATEDFEEADEIVRSQISRDKTDEYPYRLGRWYRRLYDKFAARGDEDLTRRIIGASTAIVQQIDTMDESLKQRIALAECHKLLSEIASK